MGRRPKKMEKNQNQNQKHLIIMLAIAVFGLGLYTLYTALSNGNDVTVREDVTVEVQEQPRAAVVPQENITFCIRLNGRENMHLPDLLGSPGDDDVFDNGIGGYNWSLPPKSTGDEDYGVLPDGTIFVKKEFLSKWNPYKVEIIADATGWRIIQMSEANISGKEAYIYK